MKQLGRTRLVLPPAGLSLLGNKMQRWEGTYGRCLVNLSGSALLPFQHFSSLSRACPQGQDSRNRARQALLGKCCYMEG